MHIMYLYLWLMTHLLGYSYYSWALFCISRRRLIWMTLYECVRKSVLLWKTSAWVQLTSGCWKCISDVHFLSLDCDEMVSNKCFEGANTVHMYLHSVSFLENQDSLTLPLSHMSPLFPHGAFIHQFPWKINPLEVDSKRRRKLNN